MSIRLSHHWKTYYILFCFCWHTSFWEASLHYDSDRKIVTLLYQTIVTFYGSSKFETSGKRTSSQKYMTKCDKARYLQYRTFKDCRFVKELLFKRIMVLNFITSQPIYWHYIINSKLCKIYFSMRYTSFGKSHLFNSMKYYKNCKYHKNHLSSGKSFFNEMHFSSKFCLAF